MKTTDYNYLEFEFGEKRLNIKAYVTWRREEFIFQQTVKNTRQKGSDKNSGTRYC